MLRARVPSVPTMTSATDSNPLLTRVLARIEAAGNCLPDPAVLFASLMLLVWLLSW